jgi:protein-arginine kinase activator protein McsA
MTKEVLQKLASLQRDVSKVQRKAIKDPSKLCDCCMSEWTSFSLKEEKLCDECYEEKYGKTNLG